jgi:hypothetical protein
MKLTIRNKASIKALKDLDINFVSVESFPCDRGNRKYKIGDRLELFGMEEYAELNGEIVVVTAYRTSVGDLNGYYIRSESGEVEKYLNFVWEKRLRIPS